jgi:hypothetical protein
MIRIRKKKQAEEVGSEQQPCDECVEGGGDSFFAGAFPEKPWKRLTRVKYKRGSALKVLNEKEQGEVVSLARKYFGFKESDFPRARISIQRAMDDTESSTVAAFFERAHFLEKRLAIRAYLSDAGGRFIPSAAVLPLIRHFAEAGLDFEVGAIDHYIENERKTEIVVGDGAEVISDQGYWFAHTHPAKSGITNNILPSTADIDVMIATSRSYAHNLSQMEANYYVFRDVGGTRVTMKTAKAGKSASATIEEVTIEYFFSGGEDKSVEAQATALVSHLRTRHRLKPEQITVIRLRDSSDL